MPAWWRLRAGLRAAASLNRFARRPASRPLIGAAAIVPCGLLLSTGHVFCRPLAQKSESPALQGARGIAIVTGGSRGIGAAISKVLAAEGYAVAVNFRGSEAAAEEVVTAIRKAGGVARRVYADMAVEEDIVKMFDEIQSFWPDLPLSALVNNAGINKSSKMQADDSLGSSFQTLKCVNKEAFHDMLDVNVFGALIASREFAMRASAGSIVNISSGSAVIGTGIYGMTKAAMNALQAWLVKELTPRGIRVNTVSPGLTRSDMIAEFLEKKPDLSFIPMNRAGEPSEIAEVVAFLVSEKASYVSGANIRVAGGRPPGTFIG
mmetsp:Transcript_109/g.230  ORF Transcript_109/g.230 Transcript_109/m.230 type:complete len:320 (-) Transcript_109:64-1023(-)